MKCYYVFSGISPEQDRYFATRAEAVDYVKANNWHKHVDCAVEEIEISLDKYNAIAILNRTLGGDTLPYFAETVRTFVFTPRGGLRVEKEEEPEQEA